MYRQVHYISPQRYKSWTIKNLLNTKRLIFQMKGTGQRNGKHALRKEKTRKEGSFYLPVEIQYLKRFLSIKDSWEFLFGSHLS